MNFLNLFLFTLLFRTLDNSFFLSPKHILKLINKVIIPVRNTILIIIIILRFRLKNSITIIIVSILIFPPSIFLVFEQEVAVRYSESNDFVIFIEFFSEVFEPRVRLSLFIHI